MHELEAVHALRSNPGFLVRGELHDGVTTVFTGVRILGQLDCINSSKRTEKLTNVLLSQRSKLSNQSTDVDPVIRLTLLVLVARG